MEPTNRLDRVTLVGGQIINAHPRAKCVRDYCPIHNPSQHHMVTWKQNWRYDREIMERTCSHGVGHPDPDDFRLRNGLDNGIHGCDGCCRIRGTVVATGASVTAQPVTITPPSDEPTVTVAQVEVPTSPEQVRQLREQRDLLVQLLATTTGLTVSHVVKIFNVDYTGDLDVN